jgi:uncharacterized protein (TIGR03437 family)
MSLRLGTFLAVLILSGLPAAAQLTITNSSPLPYGSLNSTYSVQLDSTGGGSDPYLYSLISGNLPPSLNLSQSGLISGTLTTAGTYTFTVRVTNGQGEFVISGSKTFSIGVPQITTNSPLPPGAINTSYSIQFQYADGPGSPFWGISAPPPGLAINASTGVLSGTPTKTGTYVFSVRADQSSGGVTLSANKTFSLAINSSSSSGPTITTTALTPGGTGQNYLQNIFATGGSPPYTYTATGLPDGLMISSGGAITGVPTTNGTFSVVIFATDSKGGQGSQSYQLTILSSLTIVTTTLTTGSVGHSYFQAIQAVGGTPPFTFTGSGFPTGIALTTDGHISGTPSQAGTFPIEVDVADAAKHFATAQYMLIIATLPVISNSSPLPSGFPGAAYSQMFTATAGLAPYNFFVLPTTTSNPLPPGLTLAQSGLLSGTPTTTGSYSFTIQVVDANQNAGTKTFQIMIGQGTSSFVISPLSLQFSGPSGGDAPGQENIVITSAGAPVSFTAQVDDGNGGPAPAWIQATPAKGTTPGAVHVSILPNTLPAGTYTARIRIGPGAVTNIPVTYTISAPAPKLSLTPSLLRFRAHIANPSTQQQTFILRNTGGGGPIPITLAVIGKSTWITSVTPSAQSVLQNAPVFVTVTVNSQGLSLGSHRDAIHVTTSLPGSQGQFDVPVTVTVLNQGAAIAVLTSGIRISTTQGSQSSRSQQVFVRNVGDPGTVVFWNAQAVRGSTFVTLANAHGASTPTGPSSFIVQATSAASSTPGAKSALIQISDSQSQNSPQFLVVVVDVAATGTAPVPDPDPSGLLYVTTSGGAGPGSQQITANTNSDSPVAFSVSTSTDDGATWLSATASSGTTSQGSPAQVTVTVSPGALSPNVYTGEVNLAIGAVVRTVNVTMVVKPAGSVATLETRAAAIACTPTSVAFVESGLVNSFSIPAGFPASLSTQVSDNCGNALTNAAVVASFSNGDPPISLLGDQSGYYAATWQPGVTTSEMTVTLDATSGLLNPAEMQLSGNVNNNAIPSPTLVTGGLLNNLNPLVGAPLAPGTVAQVYGDNFTPSSDTAGKVPLPTVLDGVEVLVGGLNAPFFYVTKVQVGVQIPNELAANSTYSALVVANGQYTVPQDVDLVSADPGTVTLADGTIAAQFANSAVFVDAAHPAKPGSALTIYLVGMGATSQTVASGNPAPSNPLANVSTPAQVTIDGQTAPISFAGLSPGGIGLYQINLTVPSTAKTGSLDVVITQNGITANATKLIVSQ